MPLAILLIALAYFVRYYFGTVRPWLFWIAVGTRLLVLLVNFIGEGSVNISDVKSLKHMYLLGQQVTLIGEAVTSPWNVLAVTNSLFFLVLFTDASIRLWWRGDAYSRRRVLCVGGALVTFMLLAAGHACLVNQQVIESPYIITICFMGIILAMAQHLGHDVSEASRLTLCFSESQQQLTLAASAAQLALWTWNVRKNEIWSTPEGRALYGLSVSERVSIERFLDTLHPEDRSRVKDAVAQAVAGDGEFQSDYRVISEGGQIRWISARGRVEFDPDGSPLLMRGVSIDNTHRSQAEERAALLVEASPYAMIMVNDSAKIVMVNRQTETSFGYSRGELLGQALEILIPERFRREDAAMRSSFGRSPSSRRMGEGRELWGLRRDGSEFPIEVGLNPIETSEGCFVLASVSDITERRRMEAEVNEQRDELTHLSRVTSLGLLSGSLAHEINQPLGIILANAQAAQRMLSQGNPDIEAIREILDDIVSEDLRAGEAIKRLRVLLKRGQSRLIPIDLYELVRDVLKLMQSDLVSRKVTVISGMGRDTALISADPVQIQQVLLNLILNACEAMEDIAEERRRVIISTRVLSDVVRISVQDQGCGLPEEESQRIFQPFFTTKVHGMGIGLAISKSIVVAHHGNLWAEPNPGGGTIFHFELHLDKTTTA